jgi:hypothetical protein
MEMVEAPPQVTLQAAAADYYLMEQMDEPMAEKVF